MTGDRDRGRKMLIRLLAERICAEYLAEQEMLARAQPGEKSIEPTRAIDAQTVAPIDVSFVRHDDGHA